MSEHGDDTTESGAPSPVPSNPAPAGSYYYDDATGYEVYDPSKEEEDDDGEDDVDVKEGERAARIQGPRATFL